MFSKVLIMKYYFLSLLGLIYSICAFLSFVPAYARVNVYPHHIARAHNYTDRQKRPKILIVSCIGGGGHTAVSKALYGNLNDSYDIKIVNFYQDIAHWFDTVGLCTFGHFRAEDFYNFCLQCRWVPVINRYLDFGCWMTRLRHSSLEQSIEYFVQQEKPDLIISVMPIVNFMILKIAQQFQIPFLVLTNDLDTTNYIHALSNPQYKKFYYSLAFDDPAIRAKIAPASLSADSVKVIGFPLRPEFFSKKDKVKIKREFGIPEDKPVVMILMGGAGSLVTVRYIKMLARTPSPIHIIACLGRNEKLRRNIHRVILPRHITLSIVGFTDRIADLMAISDVLITKPGPNSICEAIASGLPMILDKTGTTLWWELLNIDFVKQYQLGDVLTNFRDLQSVLSRYLSDRRYVHTIRNRMLALNTSCFEKNLKNLIAEIIG